MSSKNYVFPFRKLGLHPLSAFAAICVDLMLFGPEAAAPPAFILTFAFGFMISVPVYLLQKYASGDGRKVAFAKAMIIGILTAIPSPLPSVFTGLGGILGLIGSVFNSKSEVPRKTEDKIASKEDVIEIKAEKD